MTATAVSPTPLYRDRAAAGRAVAMAVRKLGPLWDPIVLALPRGGVPVARVVADELSAPLDVIVARKLGVPGMEEVALGAIAEGRRQIVEDSVRWYLGVPRRVVADIVARERRELDRRVRLYRRNAKLPNVRGKTVILVDDGFASGATLRAAALSIRKRKPARIIAAVPVASLMHVDDVRKTVDDLVVVAMLDPFGTVSAWYENFDAVGDAKVLRLLGRDPAPSGLLVTPDRYGNDERTTSIPIGGVDSGAGSRVGVAADAIVADIGMPNGTPHGLVILAHGGGSSRNSYRNRYFAGLLRREGWATMRVDLLLEREREVDAITGDARFDVPRISQRLVAAIDWACRERIRGADRVVLLGASTGASAALVAAAERPEVVIGVASRGGRVDLAGDAALGDVCVPVLMVVGENDTETLAGTRATVGRIRSAVRLTIVPGAGHTFDEPGMIGVVGEHVVTWLTLRTKDGSRPPLVWLSLN